MRYNAGTFKACKNENVAWNKEHQKDTTMSPIDSVRVYENGTAGRASWQWNFTGEVKHG